MVVYLPSSGIFDKLVERADNFNNLWGLQMQKMYLEKFIYTRYLPRSEQ